MKVGMLGWDVGQNVGLGLRLGRDGGWDED